MRSRHFFTTFTAFNPRLCMFCALNRAGSEVVRSALIDGVNREVTAAALAEELAAAKGFATP